MKDLIQPHLDRVMTKVAKDLETAFTQRYGADWERMEEIVELFYAVLEYGATITREEMRRYIAEEFGREPDGTATARH